MTDTTDPWPEQVPKQLVIEFVTACGFDPSSVMKFSATTRRMRFKVARRGADGARYSDGVEVATVTIDVPIVKAEAE